jgi:reactive intermediate/imine deaminase
MSRRIIQTKTAPAAIGTYSQAVQVNKGTLTFISGQIPLDAESMAVVSDRFKDQAHQVFKNLAAVAQAGGNSLDDCVKLTIYLTDLTEFVSLNTVMADYFSEPYPSRAAIEVSALPANVQIEIDAIIVSD